MKKQKRIKEKDLNKILSCMHGDFEKRRVIKHLIDDGSAPVKYAKMHIEEKKKAGDYWSAGIIAENYGFYADAVEYYAKFCPASAATTAEGYGFLERAIELHKTEHKFIEAAEVAEKAGMKKIVTELYSRGLSYYENAAVEDNAVKDDEYKFPKKLPTSAPKRHLEKAYDAKGHLEKALLCVEKLGRTKKIKQIKDKIEMQQTRIRQKTAEYEEALAQERVDYYGRRWSY